MSIQSIEIEYMTNTYSIANESKYDISDSTKKYLLWLLSKKLYMTNTYSIANESKYDISDSTKKYLLWLLSKKLAVPYNS